jgi:predicted amidohydrolase YtcJ
MTFHSDCWVTLHATVQKEYIERAAELGVAALVDPYQRAEMASWLPEAAIDEAVETLSEQLDHEVMADLAHLDGSPMPVERREPADEEPMAG